MADSGTRILITVDGKSRKILSVSENQSTGESLGDLYIITMPAENYSGGDPRQKSKPIAGQKFTIHNSNHSQYHNGIKLTTSFKDGTEEEKSYHYTKAIKANKLFAPIFIKCYPNLSDERYGSTPNKKKKLTLSLGEYDPSNFSMILFVAVGPVGHRLPDVETNSFTVENINFTHFTLSIVWCYVGQIPSLNVGSIAHFFTEEKKNINDPSFLKFQEKLERGYTEQECLSLFLFMREQLRVDMCRFHKNFRAYLVRTRFFRRGVKKGGPWDRYEVEQNSL